MHDEFGDWRIEAVTTLVNDVPAAYPGGPSHKAGTPIYKAISTVGTGHQPVGFIAPSATALALNIAMNASQQAAKLRSSITFDETVTPEGAGQSVINEHLPALFDFFEACMVTITFSLQALETFCNQVIGSKVQGTMKVKRKTYVVMTPEEMERSLSTDEKLSQVLPILMGVHTPKGLKVWEAYRKLKAARNSIIHMKSHDQYPHGPDVTVVDESSLFFVFLNSDMASYPIAAISMISHMYPTGSVKPRWLRTCLEFGEI